ncbi:ribonuclease J [Candidatus Gracilibacteria bacterium]|nr:ribonuclease J [Candidatus Gracilibacteria bacterium]
MEEDKLTKWLSKKGLLGKKREQKQKVQAEGTEKQTFLTKSTKNTPKRGVQTTKVSTQGARTNSHFSNKKQVGRSSQTQSTGKPNRNKNAQRSQQGGNFSKYDPFIARPTIEKRDKFHPTNFMSKIKTGEIRVVPLGGMEQVGENMMFLEWGDDIVVIDTGFLFPGPEHLGIDVLIPDISYLVKNKHKIRGVLYTHGHLDHIGGVPYILPELGYPKMYATRLTKELILAQCAEHKGVSQKLNIQEINPKSKLKLGKFEFEFFHINHSIPDGVGIVAKTVYGSIVHTSDFKFDYNPSDDQPIDLSRISKIGKEGVVLALSDSTNAMQPGQTISESVIEESLDKLITEATGRVIVATFSSNIGRVSKLVESAERNGRTVFLSGRSMERNVAIARKLNYLKCKEQTLQRMSPKARQMDPKKVLILSTGSQGEQFAALTRMAAKTHRDIKLTTEDTIVFSSSPIPGNEMAIVSVLNNLAEIECKKVDKKSLDIHVSGHAHAEECKLMASLLNPKYFAPIHGELYMRYGHRDLIVESLQLKKENTFMIKNGRGVILTEKGARLMTEKEGVAGAETLVQLGEKVHDKVLEERTFMKENGIIMVTIRSEKGSVKKVNIRANGFLYGNQNKELFALIEKEIRELWIRTYDPSRPEKVLEQPIKNKLHQMFLQKYKQEQLIEVVIL